MGYPQFHETGYGKMFFECQLPKLIKALNRLAEATETQNKLLAKTASQTTIDDAAEPVLICSLKLYKNKTTEQVGDIVVCHSPQQAVRWVDTTLLELQSLGFKPVPETKASFFDNISTKTSGLLFVYKDGNSTSDEFYALDVKEI